MGKQYSTNPAVQFRWQTGGDSDAPFTAVVADDPVVRTPVQDSNVVGLLSYAFEGKTRDQLREFLLEECNVSSSVADERISRLIEDGVLLSDQQQIDERRTWFEHEWDRSLYYHLATRDHSIAKRGSGVHGGERTAERAEYEETVSREDGIKTGVKEGRIELPSPGSVPDKSFDEVLLDRRTCRDFDGSSINGEELSSILYHALGPIRETSRPTDKPGVRDARSFFETRAFPITIYPIVARSADVDCGVYRYDLDSHALQCLDRQDGDSGAEIDDLVRSIVVEQPFAEGGSVTLLLSADLERYRRLRPESREFRHLLTIVSAHAHRLLLTATAFGFDVFQCAALKDSLADEVVGADGFREAVLYTITIGRATEEQT